MMEVQTTVAADMIKVWDYWTSPEHIMQWYSATPEWHTPRADNDLRPGGKFCYHMAAKDGSFAFDLEGTYDVVKAQEAIHYHLSDGRKVEVIFEQNEEGVRVTERFEPETQNPEDLQRQGWQAILDHFKRYTEGA